MLSFMKSLISEMAPPPPYPCRLKGTARKRIRITASLKASCRPYKPCSRNWCRWALSLLGALGFGAAPTVLRPSNAEAQTAGAAPGARRRVALALQGGGSHGAFTWGVLDRLLDDATIDIVGVTGTSAGAMNGAVLVDGLVRGGPEQARAALRRYWEGVGAMPGFGSFFSSMSGEDAARTPLESIPITRRGREEKLVAI